MKYFVRNIFNDYVLGVLYDYYKGPFYVEQYYYDYGKGVETPAFIRKCLRLNFPYPISECD